jgi:hypothetical protein
VRAPVYRAIDTNNTFLGLAFPSEVLLLFVVFWAGALTLPILSVPVVTLVFYAVLRLLTAGKPPMHLQHLALFHVRRVVSQARFSPAARAASHRRFPFAPYLARESGQEASRE